MPNAFDLKSTQLDLLSLHARSADWRAVADELLQTFGPQGDSAGFFDGDGMVLDAPAWGESFDAAACQALRDALSACQLRWVAWVEPTEDQRPWARQSGVLCVDRQRATASSAPQSPPATPVAAAQAMRTALPANALVVDKPLRSGQRVYARGTDLIALAMVNPGAEVLADGHVHVYAPLRGKAMAGVSGNTQARIFTVHMDAELVSVAGVYKTSDSPWPEALRNKPACIRLSDDGQERLLFEALVA